MYEFRLSTIDNGTDEKLYVTLEVWDRPDNEVDFPDRLWHREIAVDGPQGGVEMPLQFKELLVAIVEYL